MSLRRDSRPAGPALVPLHGNFEKRPRPLDRDVTLVGRARGCDLCLDATDVSTLHCVVYRAADGYRLRDCNSRTGTRVNGEAVKGAPLLVDGDVLNVGPFSFEVKIPPGLARELADARDPVKIEHWQASRSRLARRALYLRRRLHQLAENGAKAIDEDAALALREQIRRTDERAGQLDEAEGALAREREALRQEQEAHRRHVQQVEGDLAARLDEADRDVRQRWQEYQQRCQTAEDARLLRDAERFGAGEDATPADVQTELARLTSELRANNDRLTEQQRELAEQSEQMRRERQEFNTMKQQWENGQAEAAGALAQQEAQLRAQRAELVRMMGELRKLQDEFRKQQKGDAQGLHDENQRLKELVAEYEQRLHELADAGGQGGDDVRAENELLRELLFEKEQQVKQLQQQQRAAEPSADADELESFRRHREQLQSENDLLKQLLQEKSDALAQVQQQAAPKPAKSANELERYESELNQFRQQLEADRAKLGAEIEQLRFRNQELDEATREMEMELSRERAEMARERIRLERLRDEIKTDMEKMQRESSVRESLVNVQKLRGEMAQKRPVS